MSSYSNKAFMCIHKVTALKPVIEHLMLAEETLCKRNPSMNKVEQLQHAACELLLTEMGELYKNIKDIPVQEPVYAGEPSTLKEDIRYRQERVNRDFGILSKNLCTLITLLHRLGHKL